MAPEGVFVGVWVGMRWVAVGSLRVITEGEAPPVQLKLLSSLSRLSPACPVEALSSLRLLHFQGYISRPQGCFLRSLQQGFCSALKAALENLLGKSESSVHQLPRKVGGTGCKLFLIG